MTTHSETLPTTKFSHSKRTAKGEVRAHVAFDGMKTLWFNTGTLCNIECANCYIESSPSNDRLIYLRLSDVTPYLDELDEMQSAPIEIGITGGEPFMAPEIIEILNACLVRGHSVLLLTNAMQPMMRPRIREGIKSLINLYCDQLTFRVSMDHYSEEKHDEERGEGSFALTLKGLIWLSDHFAKFAIAGRTMWHEDEADVRSGFATLCVENGLELDTNDPTELVLFPEMEAASDPPEITTACWGILDKNPSEIMCASQRMVVRRKGAGRASVLACTLLPYDEEFELGHTLIEASKPVSLNHPYCASFCVLGGGSCSA